LSRINGIFNRWIAASLAMLFFIRAMYRFRREGDFQTHRLVFAIYLASLAALMVIGITGWGGAYRQTGGLLLVLFFGQLYTNRDLVERRSGIYFWLAVLVLAACAGAWMGSAIWSHQDNPGLSRRWLMVIGTALSSFLPLRYLFNHLGMTLNEFFNGLQFDMLFSEGAFAPKQKKRVSFPREQLLLHWRESGQTNKAWRTARRYLLDDPAAFPIWIFALETAALHLKKPKMATTLIQRLLKCENISFDQKNIALMTAKKLAGVAGFKFNESNFRAPAVQPGEIDPLVRVVALRQQGQFKEVETLLLSLIEKEPGNPQVLTHLVRLYAGDLKQINKAQRWIAKAEEHLPSYHVDFLRNSLGEWIKSETIATDQITGLSPLPPRTEESGKLVFKSYTTSAKPAENSLENNLLRQQIKKPLAELPPEDAQPPRDKMDELVADRCYGAAAEMFLKELKADPKNFDLWLRYAEVYGRHCGNLKEAEKIARQMAALRVFSDEQMQVTTSRLREWRGKHEVLFNGW
jgi:tetratricopeptide (TPR) repeat protein